MIFFDLDATILDHDAAAQAGAAKFLETHRAYLEDDLESFIVRWEAVSEKYFESFDAGRKYTLWEQRRERIREIFSEPLSDEEADIRFLVYLETYEANWKLFPDSLPCLEALKGYKLGIITNGEGEQQRSKMRKLNLGTYFSTVIISREVNCSKPDKAIFELAAKQTGVDINDCVYVGDRLQTDALGSQKAGMKGIWLDRKGKGVGKEFEVPVISSLKELPELLRQRRLE